MDQILHAAENAYHNGQHPAPDAVRDLDTILTALSGWSGMGRGAILQSFSNLITEKDGQLITRTLTGHPVVLATASTPVPPGAALRGSGADRGASAASVLLFRKRASLTQSGPRQCP